MPEIAEAHPQTRRDLESLGVQPDEWTQVVGSAPASAGYHAAEGWCADHDEGRHQFSSCVDLVRAGRFDSNDFASRCRAAHILPFYRDWQDGMAEHIHCVAVGLRDENGRATILPGPRQQIIDYTRGLNGLVNHRPLRPDAWPGSIIERDELKTAYEAWAPSVRTKVYLLDQWVPCYAFLESGHVRCEVRALALKLGCQVAWANGEVHVTRPDGGAVDLSSADPRVEGNFVRANVREVAELCGRRVERFTMHDGGEWAEVYLA
jgi:hypothetical protein